MSTLLLASSAVGAVLASGAGSLIVATILRRVVPTNEVHIVQSKGATTPYGKDREAGNVYYEWPASIPGVGIDVIKLPASNFDVSLKDYRAFDLGKLPFIVSVMAFFRIDDAEVAAQRVSSFEELQAQLSSILQGAVRSILAGQEIEHIMQDRAILGKKFTEEVEPQLAEWGVMSVKTIEFMNIDDDPHASSKVIQQIMAKQQSLIDRQSREAIAENNRSASEREIEANRQISLQEQDAARQVGEATAESEKQVGIAREQSRQAQLIEAKTTTERQMEVQRVTQVQTAEIDRSVAAVKAEQDKQVALVKAEQDKGVTIVAAEGQRQSEITEAEGEKAKTTLIAEGQLAAAIKDAEGIQARGLAEAAASQAKNIASVAAEVELADKIGSNEPYQDYLIRQRQVDASAEVGKAMAGAIANADLKIISNAGDPVSGVTGIGDLFSTSGGTKLSGMMEAFAQTDTGKAIVNKVLGATAVPPTPKTASEATTTAVPPTPTKPKR